jgi:3-oxoacyl-[acyl-carrier protein] reductase
MNLNIDLTKKHALVGGATSGIGLAAAIKLSQHGCSVTVMGRSKEKCKSVLQKLDTSNGQDHDFICVDLKDLENLSLKLKTYAESKERIDVWINNVGGPDASSLLNTSIEYMNEVFRIHVLASQVILKSLVPNFKLHKNGKIVNILGTSLVSHISYLAPSSVRSAMLNWSKHAAMELGEVGVTVNNIMPGPVDTPELKRLAVQLAEIKETTPETILNGVIEDTIVKRIAQPDEIASVILLMISDYFKYATGSTIVIDGGMSKRVV